MNFTFKERRDIIKERKMWFNHWKQLAEKQRRKYYEPIQR